MKNVVSEVVENGICIGCGVCAGICPNVNLSIEFNTYGEYNSKDNGKCSCKCELCLKVCPFSEYSKKEDTIATEKFSSQSNVKLNDITGYHLQSYVGYSLVGKQRLNGSSGGIVTWLLESMLNNCMVDFVVCVSPTENVDKLFSYKIFNNVEEVRKSSRSAYYPVELSEIVSQIVKEDGKYAVVGLPCYLKGLELAKEQNKILKERIVVSVGLVCGQLKSSYYTKYLGHLAGIKSDLDYVCYRSKNETTSAIDFKFLCRDVAGNEGELSFQRDIKEIWNGRWFTPPACNFCEDIFAEVADVTVMDAWLDRYSSDNKGTSIIITRHSVIESLINDGIKCNELNLSPLDIDEVVNSQRNVVKIKRTQIKYRLYRRFLNNKKSITKRSGITSKLGLVDKLEVLIKDKSQRESRKYSVGFNSHKHTDYVEFTNKMAVTTKYMKILNIFIRVRSKIFSNS